MDNVFILSQRPDLIICIFVCVKGDAPSSGGWLGGGRVVLTSGSGRPGRPRNWRVGRGRGGGAGWRTYRVRI